MDTLRQEAVVTQADELSKLAAVEIFGMPRSWLTPVKAVLIGREEFLNLLSGTISFQCLERIAKLVAHQNEIAPIALGLFNLGHSEIDLDPFGRTLDDQVGVDLLLNRWAKFFHSFLQILLE